MEIIRVMKKHEWYLVEAEQMNIWGTNEWERKAEPLRTMKQVRALIKKLKKMKETTRNIRVFKVAPYEEINV